MSLRIFLTFGTRRCFSSPSKKEFDVAIIGGGPGGYVAAIKAAQLGLKTACIEKRSTLGGTCLNVGCIPSKALLHNSHLYHATKTDYAKRGIEVSDVKMNLDKLMAYKDKTVTQLTKGIEYLFKKNKVESVFGTASFINPREILVTDSKGGQSIISATNIIIATGSEPASFPGTAIDEVSVVTSTGALSFPQVPEKLAVIGGGVIGLELGSVWSRLGSQVTVIEYMDSVGSGMDLSTASQFQKILAKQGLSFKLGTKVNAIKTVNKNHHEITVEPARGGPKEVLIASAVLVSIGRRPNTDGLNLDKIGIKLDAKGRIITDDMFRTSINHIRAIGDVIQGPMLAHKAEEEGIAVAHCIANQKAHVYYDAIPSVIYTHPEVAWVGKTEEQIKSLNIPYVVGNFPMLANSRAKTNDDAEGFVKLLSHAETGQVLGCHIIGPNAGEMIIEGTLAIQHKLTAGQLAETSHAHPTLSEAFKEASLASSGLKKAIHF